MEKVKFTPVGGYEMLIPAIAFKTYKAKHETRLHGAVNWSINHERRGCQDRSGTASEGSARLQLTTADAGGLPKAALWGRGSWLAQVLYWQ